MSVFEHLSVCEQMFVIVCDQVSVIWGSACSVQYDRAESIISLVHKQPYKGAPAEHNNTGRNVKNAECRATRGDKHEHGTWIPDILDILDILDISDKRISKRN